MKKYTGKILFIAATVGLAIYFLWPTYKDYEIHKTLSGLRGDDSAKFVDAHENDIREYRTKRIKLGLDLQGGMRVVLEVNVLKLIEDLAKNRDDVFAAIMKEVREESRKTDESPVLLLRKKFEARQIRLSRYYRNLRDTNDDIYKFLSDEATKAIDRGIEIVRNRVDQYGVSEPSIQKLGENRISVELPGVTKEAEVRTLLQGTALLEFKLLKEPEVSYRVMQSIDKLMASTAGADSTDTTAAATAAVPGDTAKISTPEGEMSSEEFSRKHPFFTLAIVNPQQFPGEAIVAEENKEKVRRILDRDEIKRIVPNDMAFAWSAKSRLMSNGKRFFTLYPVKITPELTGGVITNARATIDPSFNQPVVTMEMNNEGSREWARITGANINKRIAIVLDNSVFSAPVVRNKITGGIRRSRGWTTWMKHTFSKSS